jgi:hypothetical protein
MGGQHIGTAGGNLLRNGRFLPQWEIYLIRNGTAPHGPEPGLFISEIITILLMLHDSRFEYLKSFL